jgi:hypothetical protein
MSNDGPASGPRDFVRPFVLTGGRTKAARTDLRVETMVKTSHRSSDESIARLAAEAAAIARLCREAQSIAEVSAKLHLALGVAMILVGDLVDAGHLSAVVAAPIEISLLEKVLAGIKAL